MVNMFSANIGSGQYPLGPLGVKASGDNTVNNYHAKYGCGYEDFGYKPYLQSYPMSYIQRVPEPVVKRNLLEKILNFCYIR